MQRVWNRHRQLDRTSDVRRAGAFGESNVSINFIVSCIEQHNSAYTSMILHNSNGRYPRQSFPALLPLAILSFPRPPTSSSTIKMLHLRSGSLAGKAERLSSTPGPPTFPPTHRHTIPLTFPQTTPPCPTRTSFLKTRYVRA